MQQHHHSRKGKKTLMYVENSLSSTFVSLTLRLTRLLLVDQTAIVDTPVTLSEPPVIPSAEPSPIDSVLSPIIDTPTSPTPPRSSPSPQPATPDPEDDCPPCEDEPLFTSESPSGKVCYCLGGGQKGRNNGDRQPWAWGGPFCQYGSDGAVSDYDDYVCLFNADEGMSTGTRRQRR